MQLQQFIQGAPEVCYDGLDKRVNGTIDEGQYVTVIQAVTNAE
jgi:hypothetical protein